MRRPLFCHSGRARSDGKTGGHGPCSLLCSSPPNPLVVLARLSDIRHYAFATHIHRRRRNARSSVTTHVPLPRTFYMRPVRTVARQLLGKVLVRHVGRTTLSGIIVEVEAYNGSNDPASHAFRGRTPRNEVMFGNGGHLYVYFTYGMHFCANVVTGHEGAGSAVLLRALEPLRGIPAMAHNRNRPERAVKDLLSGPAKLCQAMEIGREENGADLCGNEIWIEDHGMTMRPRDIAATPRIGITRGKEHLWRYVVRESAFLSRPVR